VTGGRAGGSRVRTVFLGSGGFGVETLARLSRHPDIDLVGVVTAPARPAGRGRMTTQTEIEGAARSHGIATIRTPERLRAPDAIADVLALQPGLAILADYGQLVPSALLDLPHGALNLHPSLLPRHRGATPIPATILAGDDVTGVTLIRMDEGLDSGPIVDRRTLALRGTETTPELEAALAGMAADLLGDGLRPWLRGDLAARPQPEAGATMTRPLRREDGRLAPTRPATELERQVRAYQPWPGSFVDTVVGRLVVWAASLGPGTDREPGSFGPDGLATAEGELLLRDVQPAGGRRMPWDAFLRGRAGILGSAALASARDD
jgi:methionyl-tRNA formyltransferase